jgi:hypothetical protein
MAGSQGMPTSVVPQQGQPQSTPSVFNMANQPSADVMSPAVMPTQPSMGGGKGAGPMQPQKTAMGTPITYGNVYSNSNQTFNPSLNLPSTINPSLNPPSTANPTVTEKPYDVLQDPSFYMAADGTTSVPGYAMGTTGVDDPWDWVNSRSAAPMAAEIRPSTEQALGRVPDQTQQQLASMAMTKGVDAADKGITAGYNAYKMAGPLAEAQAISQAAATDMALGGMGGSAGAAALTNAATTGAALAEGGAAASALGAGTGAAGLGGALGAGGSAAMAALASNPVGWAIGAGLLAKKLKIF